MDFVSIITATYNSEKFILDLYDSLKKQEYSHWEWIITDDCSSDQTIEILNVICNEDKRVRFFRNEKNLGAALSRNNSLNNCKGNFIAFIDSDDLWYPQKLSQQLNFMNTNDIDFSFTSYELVNELGDRLNKVVDVKNTMSAYNYEDMLKKRATLGCSTVMLRRDNNTFEFRMPNIRTGQDYAFWLKLLKSGRNAYLLRDVLTQYRITSGSISRNKIKKALRQWSIYRDIEGLSYFKTLKCFAYYAWHAVFRN